MTMCNGTNLKVLDIKKTLNLRFCFHPYPCANTKPLKTKKNSTNRLLPLKKLSSVILPTQCIWNITTNSADSPLKLSNTSNLLIDLLFKLFIQIDFKKFQKLFHVFIIYLSNISNSKSIKISYFSWINRKTFFIKIIVHIIKINTIWNKN